MDFFSHSVVDLHDINNTNIELMHKSLQKVNITFIQVSFFLVFFFLNKVLFCKVRLLSARPFSIN